MTESDELRENIEQVAKNIQSYLWTIQNLGPEVRSQELLTKLKEYEHELWRMAGDIREDFEAQLKPRRE